MGRMADEVLRPVSEQGAGGGIDEGDAPLAVHAIEPVGAGLDDVAGLGLGLGLGLGQGRGALLDQFLQVMPIALQLRLGLFEGGDVVIEAQDPDDRPPAVPQRHLGGAQPEGATVGGGLGLFVEQLAGPGVDDGAVVGAVEIGLIPPGHLIVVVARVSHGPRWP